MGLTKSAVQEATAQTQTAQTGYLGKLGLKVTRRVVPTKSIHPNPWNYRGMSPAMFEKEKTSIETYGYIRPILTRIRAEGGEEIIDGEHRWLVMDQHVKAEEMEIDCLGVIDDRLAKKLTIVLNETHGEVRYDDLAQLVAELDAQDGHLDLLDELPFDPAELKALLSLNDQPEYGEPPPVDDLDDGEERASVPPKADEPEWETLTLSVPSALKERFLSAVKALTADVKKVPKEVRQGIALDRMLDAHEAQQKIAGTPQPKPRTRTKSAPPS